MGACAPTGRPWHPGSRLSAMAAMATAAALPLRGIGLQVVGNLLPAILKLAKGSPQRLGKLALHLDSPSTLAAYNIAFYKRFEAFLHHLDIWFATLANELACAFHSTSTPKMISTLAPAAVPVSSTLGSRLLSNHGSPICPGIL